MKKFCIDCPIVCQSILEYGCSPGNAYTSSLKEKKSLLEECDESEIFELKLIGEL